MQHRLTEKFFRNHKPGKMMKPGQLFQIILGILIEYILEAFYAHASFLQSIFLRFYMFEGINERLFIGLHAKQIRKNIFSLEIIILSTWHFGEIFLIFQVVVAIYGVDPGA